MATIFFTGFPGFLGSELLPRVLSRERGAVAACLVQPRFAELARNRAAELEAADPSLAGRIRLVEGDITAPDLGLGAAADLHADVVEVWHLAAVYDLSVRRDVGTRVNVLGTRNVLGFAKDCPGLRRLHYVSTCYVSGRFPGLFGEDDLVKGQAFNNFYEETKYLAEVEVQLFMRGGLPATIYRPGIVVGDSATGATQKYDGPYHVIRWLLRNPPLALMPVVGDPTACTVNLVPRDFVVAAMAHLSGLPHSLGKVYQLADPEPLTVDALLSEVARATGRRLLRIPLPLGLAKLLIDKVPGVNALLRIPSASVDYFVHPTRYSAHNTLADLAGSGIVVPPFPSYVDKLVEFVRRHPEIGSAAMA
jgi:thioester reductase-like protein